MITYCECLFVNQPYASGVYCWFLHRGSLLLNISIAIEAVLSATVPMFIGLYTPEGSIGANENDRKSVYLTGSWRDATPQYTS